MSSAGAGAEPIGSSSAGGEPTGGIAPPFMFVASDTSVLRNTLVLPRSPLYLPLLETGVLCMSDQPSGR